VRRGNDAGSKESLQRKCVKEEDKTQIRRVWGCRGSVCVVVLFVPAGMSLDDVICGLGRCCLAVAETVEMVAPTTIP
jgi:hypothetical protein